MLSFFLALSGIEYRRQLKDCQGGVTPLGRGGLAIFQTPGLGAFCSSTSAGSRVAKLHRGGEAWQHQSPVVLDEAFRLPGSTLWELGVSAYMGSGEWHRLG